MCVFSTLAVKLVLLREVGEVELEEHAAGGVLRCVRAIWALGTLQQTYEFISQGDWRI